MIKKLQHKIIIYVGISMLIPVISGCRKNYRDDLLMPESINMKNCVTPTGMTYDYARNIIYIIARGNGIGNDCEQPDDATTSMVHSIQPDDAKSPRAGSIYQITKYDENPSIVQSGDNYNALFKPISTYYSNIDDKLYVCSSKTINNKSQYFISEYMHQSYAPLKFIRKWNIVDAKKEAGDSDPACGRISQLQSGVLLFTNPFRNSKNNKIKPDAAVYYIYPKSPLNAVYPWVMYSDLRIQPDESYVSNEYINAIDIAPHDDSVEDPKTANLEHVVLTNHQDSGTIYILDSNNNKFQSYKSYPVVTGYKNDALHPLDIEINPITGIVFQLYSDKSQILREDHGHSCSLISFIINKNRNITLRINHVIRKIDNTSENQCFGAAIFPMNNSAYIFNSIYSHERKHNITVERTQLDQV